MQSYILKLDANRQADVIQIQGRKFVYESTATATDSRIRVKPDRGGEVVLKAGQWFAPENGVATTFTVTAYTLGNVVDGVLVIGDGDFGDNATNSTVAGIVAVSSGQLNVVNTDAAPVITRENKLATITQGTTAVGLAQVAITADPDLKTITVRNNHATAQIAIGLTGVTIASAVIVLQPNDVWETERLAGASWFAISDIAGGSVAWIKGKE